MTEGGRGQERWVELPGRGRTWVYDIPGPTLEAPALLLVHGLGVTSHLTWGPSYAALSRHFRVIALDLPGHGRGGRPRRRFRLEACADQAMAVLDALGVSRVVVVGYSLGGTVAKLAWRRHPERVAGLVLAATAARFGRGRRARVLRVVLLPVASVMARLRPGRLRELLIERALFRLDRFADPAHIAAELGGHHLPSLVQAIGAAVRFSSQEWLGEIDVPVAVVVTAEDDRIAPRLQLALAAGIARARIFEVPGPHTACATRPEAFVPAFVEACRHAWSAAQHGPATATCSDRASSARPSTPRRART